MPQVAAEWRSWITRKDETGREKPTNFGRWVRDMQQGSQNTADENARKLVFYCRHVGLEHGAVARCVNGRPRKSRCAHVGITPDELAEEAKADPRAVSDALGDFVHEMTGAGKSGGYVRRYVIVVQSWLKWNEVTLPRKPKIRGHDFTPTLRDEMVPTQKQLRQALTLASTRGRVSTAMMAFTGIRPEVLGDMEGKDGLRLADLPDLRLDGEGAPCFDALPARVQVRAEISKTKRPYLTFLPGEGCEYVLAYLKQRTEEGEKLTPSSPLISNQTPGRFIWTRNVTREVRAALRAAGIQSRPYSLRCFHSTALLAAESRKGLPHAYTTHFCGHTGDMDARYSIQKGRLPPDLIADMRKKYADAAEFLTTTAESLDDGQLRRIAELEARLAEQARELTAARAAGQVQAETMLNAFRGNPEALAQFAEMMAAQALPQAVASRALK